MAFSTVSYLLHRVTHRLATTNEKHNFCLEVFQVNIEVDEDKSMTQSFPLAYTYKKQMRTAQKRFLSFFFFIFYPIYVLAMLRNRLHQQNGKHEKRLFISPQPQTLSSYSLFESFFHHRHLPELYTIILCVCRKCDFRFKKI